jgi:hypothetical protein
MPLVTVERAYEFEVAFSFLKEDESLAYKINDAIQDRYKTFIYGEHQRELVGNDGTEIFRQVFEEKARIVVILYRESWGTTFWTRVEETAIKHRSLEESPDFTIFISLDGNKPIWLSKTQIWYDFNRFGVVPTAAIIEKKIAEYCGQIREESIQDQAKRLKRQIKRQKDLEEYLLSNQGLIDGMSEVDNVLNIAETNMNEISERATGFFFDTSKKEKESITSYGRKIGLTIKWNRKYSNSLSESYLCIFIAHGDYYRNFPGRDGYVYKKEEYIFYENEAKTKGWVKRKDKIEFKTSEQLVSMWQKDFVERDLKDLNTVNRDYTI